MADLQDRIARLMEQPYWIIDILPRRVPRDSRGQYFAVERYFLAPSRLRPLRRKYADILLKLNCYEDLLVFPSPDGPGARNPAPEELERLAADPRGTLTVLVEGADALIVLNGDDTYATVYHAPEELIALLRQLARANGLFVWRPADETG